MKYIIFQSKVGMITRELPVIFPDALIHKEIADAIVAHNADLKLRPIAAGQCNSLEMLCQCYGESTTLGMRSRGNIDSKLIAAMDYLHGIVD